MPEIIERRNLVQGSVFAAVEIIAHLVRRLKIDQLYVIGRAHRIDNAKQILFLLSLPALVSRTVDHPSDVRRGTILLAELADPDSAGSDKVHPPIVVGFNLILFPFHDRGSAGHDDVFVVVLSKRGGG